jgi:hypothetical protein
MTYYTSSYAMRQTRTIRRNRNSVKFNDKRIGLGPISNAITLALILCMLGLLYLTQITKQTSYGYEVNTLETQKSQLLSEQESLEVEAARLQALDRIQKSKVARDLVKPTNVEFSQ